MRRRLLTPGLRDWHEVTVQAAALAVHTEVLILSAFAVLYHAPRLWLALRGRVVSRGL